MKVKCLITICISLAVVIFLIVLYSFISASFCGTPYPGRDTVTGECDIKVGCSPPYSDTFIQDDMCLPTSHRLAQLYSNPQSLTCTQDSDCASQQTGCGNCGCPKAVNINFEIEIYCPEFGAICDNQCLKTTPRCINETCVLIP
jgi:hypothetical protein